MRRSVSFFLILLAVFLSLPSQAASRESVEHGSEGDTLAQKRSGWLFFPILFYSPETKTGFGAGAGYFFREPGSATASRPSTIMTNFMYTQKKQVILDLLTDIYWKDEAYHLTGSFGYLKFPDKFYGIGNDTSEDNEEDYTPKNTAALISLLGRVRSGLYVGLQYQFYDSKIQELEEGGLLASKDIPGSEGGTATGAGILTTWDTRNNIYYPSTGTFCQLTATLFSDDLGGDYDFKVYNLDFRQYFAVFSSHVLALQAYGRSMNGYPPFQLLSLLGGDSMMRGYYEGRYRNHDMIIFQMEHRMPVWWKFGLVGFVGFGDVAGKMSTFQLKDFKTSLGIGIRYLFVPKEKLNLRFDFGFGKGSSGFYINFTEAF
jgi:outer membrane protein assembly factor BamA